MSANNARVAVVAIPVRLPKNVVAVITPATNILPATPTPPATCNAPEFAELTLAVDVTFNPEPAVPPITQLSTPLYKKLAYGVEIDPTCKPLSIAKIAVAAPVLRVIVLSPVLIVSLLTTNCVPSTYKSPARYSVPPTPKLLLK